MSIVSDLQEIRDYVGKRFSYTPDEQGRGQFEHWVDQDELAGLDGLGRREFKDDCDGFALACRYQCRKQGIPSRLVFCRTERGGGHLVLEVEGYILDNRTPWVLPRDAVAYEWISISGYNKGDPWHQIQEQPQGEGN